MTRIKNMLATKNGAKMWLVVAVSGMLVGACQSDPNSPGIEYMPDMYRSPSFETYGENEVGGQKIMSARIPANNTIPRGKDNLPYPYPNTFEGYEAAGANLKNPFPASEENLAEGKVLYTRFCVHCHGKKGMGDGTVPTNSEYPPPPAYSKGLKDLPEGKMFHTLTHGKNLMGSHASQLTKSERWKVILYVQTLQNPGGKKGTEQPAEENNSEQEESK